jgi:hypothetical protein
MGTRAGQRQAIKGTRASEREECERRPKVMVVFPSCSGGAVGWSSKTEHWTLDTGQACPSVATAAPPPSSPLQQQTAVGHLSLPPSLPLLILQNIVLLSLQRQR